jgi:S-adenosylmethionine hydrolase
VVDPGVGTRRRPLAACIGGQFFVGPDNGLVSLWLEAAERHGLETHFVHLDQPAYWLPQVSASFHGRDIFAPVGAHLATGDALEVMGSPVDDPVRIRIPQPGRTERGWQGQVTHIDHFGNCATNLEQAHLDGLVNPTFIIKGRTIRGMVKSYGERPHGELVAMIDSGGWLEIATVNGSAEQALQARVGDGIEVTS